MESAIARRLSFGSSVEDSRFPMHKYVSYYNEELDQKLNFLEYLHMAPDGALEIEQRLFKGQQNAESLQMDLVDLLVQERILEALLNAKSLEDLSVDTELIAKQKARFQEAERQAETVRREIESVLHTTDSNINIICENYDGVKNKREEIKAELASAQKHLQLQQQPQNPQSATQSRQQQKQNNLDASMDAMDFDKSIKEEKPEAASTWYSIVSTTLSQLSGVEIVGIKEVSQTPLIAELTINFTIPITFGSRITRREFIIVTAVRPTACLLSPETITVSPAIKYEDIAQAAIGRRDLSFFMAEFAERVACVSLRQMELDNISERYAVDWSVDVNTLRAQVGSGENSVIVTLNVATDYPHTTLPIQIVEIEGVAQADQLQKTLQEKCDSQSMSITAVLDDIARQIVPIGSGSPSAQQQTASPAAM